MVLIVSSSSITGPAIGGTVGGIIAISTVIFILFWMRRRTRRGDTIAIDPDPNILSNVDRIPIVGAGHRPSSIAIDSDPNVSVSNVDRIPIAGAVHRPSSIVIDSDPNIPVSDVDLIPIVGASHRPGSKDTPSNLTGSSPNPVVEQPPQSHDTSASPNHHIPHSPSPVPLTSPLPVSTLPSGRHASTVNDAILTAPGPSSASDSTLAVEEVRFLRLLYARNAPANEIAELMQAMQAKRLRANAESPDNGSQARLWI
jgi:hypothetical protein